jgi:hypothetical protein
METFSHNDSLKSQRLSVKEIPTLPDIHPTRVLFEKYKLPDGIILLSVAMARSLNMLRPSAKTTIPLA